jgi:hypothetical protein
MGAAADAALSFLRDAALLGLVLARQTSPTSASTSPRTSG